MRHIANLHASEAKTDTRDAVIVDDGRTSPTSRTTHAETGR